MSAARPPLVSIGMPVYNGERFLSRAVETLLAQDLGDFELLISDNASTDGTEDVARAFAAADRRVRYERHPVNRGASFNFNRLLSQSHPEARYLKWAAADDEHAPGFLRATVACLEADPGLAVAHSRTADIDEEGYVLRERQQPDEPLADPDPAVRLSALVTLRHECFGAFGVYPAAIVRATRGLQPFADADNVLLAELALRGRFATVPETLFFRRQHADRSMAAFVHARHRIAWFDPTRRGAVTFPSWRVGAEFVRAVHRAPLAPAERRACYQAMSVFVRYNWQNLVKNVVRSGAEATARALGPPGQPAGGPA
jgi:glycosyltransferase involved in cell wall biosynthesis